MSRPLTREQALENSAFLRHLRRTGNVRESARAVGVGYGTNQYRRKAHADFAMRWDVAMATAQARLFEAGGRVGPTRRGAGDPHVPRAASRWWCGCAPDGCRSGARIRAS